MYKVFVNDKPIIFTSSLKKEKDFPVYLFRETVIDEILYKLKNESIKGVILYCADIENGWNQFTQKFPPIPAAGGLVLNKHHEILFIYRGNKWDLPKGHIEKGESKEIAAVREVEEECGIHQLKIIHFLITTYHLFFKDDKYQLKQTHWFLMRTLSDETPNPQLEEGITEAKFVSEKDLAPVFKNSYANIQLVYQKYKESFL